jgi:hypothetical protein
LCEVLKLCQTVQMAPAVERMQPTAATHRNLANVAKWPMLSKKGLRSGGEQ